MNGDEEESRTGPPSVIPAPAGETDRRPPSGDVPGFAAVSAFDAAPDRTPPAWRPLRPARTAGPGTAPLIRRRAWSLAHGR